MKHYFEENGYYAFEILDPTIFIDNIHEEYSKVGLNSLLCDADFVIHDNDEIIMIEYKNGTVGKAEKYSEFNPIDDRHIRKVARKFYDTAFYLNHFLATLQSIKYVYIVEYPNADATTRKALRNKVAEYLPFKIQSNICPMIESFDVLSINEWNIKYPQYPLKSKKECMHSD